MVTGYTTDNVDYEVDAFRVKFEMLISADALLSFGTSSTSPQTGDTVDLTIKYTLTQSLQENGLFLVTIPKDLTQYAPDGIAPRSALIRIDTDTDDVV